MRILHWLKKENSGLFRTVVELASYEEKLGHHVSIRTPAENEAIYGEAADNFDIHAIHSQIHPMYYKDGKPKVLFLHGEPDYGLMNQTSIEAILDLAPIVDAFVSFHADEARLWQTFHRTYTIPKGVNLNRYRPLGLGKKLTGNPAVLYCEHWRRFRHPFHVFVALEKARKELPGLIFYPFGCPKEDQAFWLRIVRQNRYNIFTPGIFRWQPNMVGLLNLADIVVSPVYPSYGRVSLEALACNKPVVAYNTNPHAEYRCRPYDPDDMADKIVRCWTERTNGQRKYAEKNLDMLDTAKAAVAIYERLV